MGNAPVNKPINCGFVHYYVRGRMKCQKPVFDGFGGTLTLKCRRPPYGPKMPRIQ